MKTSIGSASSWVVIVWLICFAGLASAQQIAVNDSDVNLIARTNDAPVVTVTGGADFAGDDMGGVDTTSTAGTIAVQARQKAISPTVYVVGSGGQFGRFDLATRVYTEIVANAFPGLQITGMAYRTTTGVMYVNVRSATTELRSVNLTSGAMSTVAAYNYGSGVSTDTVGIAFNSAGSQFIYSFGNDAIFSVNTATAVGTQLGGGSGITTASPLSGKLAFAGSTLYGAMSLTPSSSNGLYSFDTSTGASTSLGNGGAGSTYTNLITFGDGGTLYGINGVTLYQINTATGALTNLGAIAGANLPTSIFSAAIAPAPVGADLSITKTDGASSEIPGTPVTYAIIASNAGPSNVTGATVADTFPAVCTGATWTCAGAAGGTCAAGGSGNINDTVNLPVGGSVNYTASCNIAASATGTLTNTATVSSAVADPMPGNNSATDTNTLTPRADLSITKTDGVTSVNAGSSTTYTITASNAGPSNAPGSTVADTFPAACAGVAWTCVGVGGGTCTASGSGDINATVNLPAGGSATYTATCPISGAATGMLINTATVATAGGVTDPTANNSATDNDTIIAVPVVSVGNQGITEGDSGTANMQFTVSRSTNGTAFDVTVATNNGSALAGEDYTTTSTTLNFAANGVSSQSVNVPIVGDNRVEGSESFTISLSNPTNGAQLGTAIGTGSITDNDSATVQFAPTSVSQSEATSPMAFTVTLSNPVQSGVTLTVNSMTGSAGAADFTAISNGTVTFAPNSNTSQTVNVVVSNDALDENDENFSLALSGLTAVGNVTLGAATAVGTILDDDPLPALSISSPSLAEGNAGTSVMNFTVSLSAVSGRDVVFTRATADGTATVANNDYVALAPASATIAAGQSSLTIPVTINGDGVYEGNETFTLNLSAVSNATPAGLSGTGTILDDDQQPTTTTINSDVPDPSVTGQPYTVSVTVAAQTSSPLGTVTISDGSASCGPVTLTTGTAPNSSASCALTSTSAGVKTLTASYTPASTAFAASSGTAGHQVNAAATAISVVGPARSRINQPTTFTFALSVSAPGAGSPAGTVTLSSGASTCSVTVPTATPSCALSFPTLGARTVSAAFVPGNTSYTSSSSSGSGNAQTLVYALSDIAVTKTDAVSSYRPGDLIVYTVTVRNNGPDTAVGIRVRDNVPAGLTGVTWSCDASGGAVCAPTGGSGSLDVTVPSLINGALLNYTFFGTVAGSPDTIVNTALVELPADTTVDDPNLSNNSASDTDLLDNLFKNGFEDAAMSAPAGSYRLPSAALRSALDEVAVAVYRLDDANGEALRVYARVFDGQMQYALATRDASGALRLGGWRSYAAEPSLNWTARQQAAGWVLESAELQ